MKNEAQVTETLTALVTRAASIELRFTGKGEIADSLKIYPEFVEGLGRPNSTKPPVSMRLGDMQELRFVEAASNSSCTVIYWELIEDTNEGILAACKDLEANGCKTVEAIHFRPDQPETACCLMQDPGGNLFGLIINPPYPLIGGGSRV